MSLQVCRRVAASLGLLVFCGGNAVKARSNQSSSGVGAGTIEGICLTGTAPWRRTRTDGFDDDIDRVIRTDQTRAIEVHMNPGLALTLYRRPDDQCGLVLIWTKPQPKELTQAAPWANSEGGAHHAAQSSRNLLGAARSASYLAATRQFEPTFPGRLGPPNAGAPGRPIETAEASRRRDTTSGHPQGRYAHS